MYDISFAYKVYKSICSTLGKKESLLYLPQIESQIGNSGFLSSVALRWLASSAAPAVIFTKDDSDL